MSRVLFWYLFKDLARIFMLAAGVIAGIMSFGGLLRPLTHNGLDAAQVAKMLGYLMPAMMTYSLPIAALFATTIVYGRLSADNELTACRAAGISYLAVALPALVLGLLVALVSLLFLCYVVPTFSLKVEKTLYSNVAQLVAHEIERTHELRVKRGPTVFAQRAYLPPPLPAEAGVPQGQRVVLEGPTIITYDKPRPDQPPTPREFMMARRATLFINQPGEDAELSLSAILEGGISFPRQFSGWRGGVEANEFGPIYFPSMIKEDTKFMDVTRLRRLSAHPEKSRRVRDTLAEFTRRDQEVTYLLRLYKQLESPGGRVLFDTGTEGYELVAAAVAPRWSDSALLLDSAAPSSGPGARQVRLNRFSDGQANLSATCTQMLIKVAADPQTHRLRLRLELRDAQLQSGSDITLRESYPVSFTVPMPASIRNLEQRNVADYLRPDAAGLGDQNRLQRDMLTIANRVSSEMHSRASFAVSCLILVLVGCALGMMFRSGNFLSAFALSVLPALLCITLTIAGQRTSDDLPQLVLGNKFVNPLNMGLTLIWSGNVIALLIAGGLMARLRRQ